MTTKLDRENFLLVQFASECLEVGHRVTKVLQFGLDQVQAGHQLDNAERVAEEFGDLFGVYVMLRNERILPSIDFDSASIRKRNKVERYIAYAMGGDRPSDDGVKS